jgi:hypothetical protein
LPGSVRVQQAASEVRRLLSGAGRAVGRAWTHRWANVRLRYAARASRVRSPRRPLIERFGRGLQHGVLAGSLAGVGWVLVTTVFVPGDGIREPGGPTASREQPQDAAGSPGDARLAGLIADSMTRAAESAARESAAPPTVGESASGGSGPAAASPSEIGADELIEEDSAPVAEAAPTEPAPAPATARLAVVRPEAVVETADSGDDDAAAADVTPTEAARLVRTFRRYYEERRVEKLVSLFADGAIENTRTGRQAIGAAYHAALTPLRSVRYELGRLRFEERSPGIRVRSPFTITYARPEQAQIVRGVAVWDIVRQGDGLEIARLTYDVHR